MPEQQISLENQTLSRNLASSLDGNTEPVDQEAVEGRVLAAAISQLAGRPGFNPATISVVFGLKP